MARAPALEKMTVGLFIAQELHIYILCDKGYWTPFVTEQAPMGACTKAYQWTGDEKLEEEEGELIKGFRLSYFVHILGFHNLPM